MKEREGGREREREESVVCEGEREGGREKEKKVWFATVREGGREREREEVWFATVREGGREREREESVVCEVERDTESVGLSVGDFVGECGVAII